MTVDGFGLLRLLANWERSKRTPAVVAARQEAFPRLIYGSARVRSAGLHLPDRLGGHRGARTTAELCRMLAWRYTVFQMTWLHGKALVSTPRLVPAPSELGPALEAFHLAGSAQRPAAALAAARHLCGGQNGRAGRRGSCLQRCRFGTRRRRGTRPSYPIPTRCN
jgi:hypothetical protein